LASKSEVFKRWKKWIPVIFYIICIAVATPYLPRLIKWASGIWSSGRVANLVLMVEIGIALVILGVGIWIFAVKRKKALVFFMVSGGIIFTGAYLYKHIPNPYEFTHFPEYGILSVLVIRAMKEEKLGAENKTHLGCKKKEKKRKRAKLALRGNPYMLSAIMTGVVGSGDEIYQHFLPGRFFTWYDIILNFLGGILGLVIYWGLKR